MQSQLRTDVKRVIQSHFGNQDLHGNHRLLTIKPLNDLLDLLHVPRSGTDDQTVGRWLRDDEDFSVNPLKQTDRLTGNQLLSDHRSLVGQQRIERVEHVDRICVTQPNHFIVALLPTGLIESIQQSFDHFKVRWST